MKKCMMEISIDPGCMEMDAATFRQFVSDQCFPPFYETLADLRSRKLTIEPVLTEQMRGGEVGASCHADSHGNAGCSVSGSIRW